MSTYYGRLYNSYGLNSPIRKGDRVEIVERDMLYVPGYGQDVDVLWAGTVEALRLTKASEGYTVLVRVTETLSIWARPDELRRV